MSCTRRKINPKICQQNETPEMHSKYIKENGLDSYNSLMGIKHDQTGTKLDDHSSTVNLGLINMESKTESDAKYEYNGLTVKEYIEIGLAILEYWCREGYLQIS